MISYALNINITYPLRFKLNTTELKQGIATKLYLFSQKYDKQVAILSVNIDSKFKSDLYIQTNTYR